MDDKRGIKHCFQCGIEYQKLTGPVEFLDLCDKCRYGPIPKEVPKPKLDYQAWFDKEAYQQAEHLIDGRTEKPVLPFVWDKWLQAIDQYDAGEITRERLEEIGKGFLLWYERHREDNNRLMDEYFWDKP